MGSPFKWTATAISTALRNTVGDPSGATTPRWTVAEVDAYLNRAMLQVTLDAELTFPTSWLLDITAGDREYALPSNFYKAESVEWIHIANTDIRPLKYIPREVYRDLILKDETSQGTMWGYYIWKKLGDVVDPTSYLTASIFIHPTPNVTTSGSDDQVRISGYKYPDVIDTVTNPTYTIELEPVHAEAVIMWAAYLVLSDDGDPRATEKLGAYQMLVEKNKASAARRDLTTVSKLRPKGHRRLPEDLPQGTPWIRW